MEKTEIAQTLKRILVEDLFVADSPEDIDIDGALDNDLGLDSVGFVELATLVGETFKIKVTDTDVGAGHFASVGKLSGFIHDRLAEQAVKA